MHFRALAAIPPVLTCRLGGGRLAVLVGLCVLGVIGAGTSKVYWTATGSGPGSGTAQTMSTVTVAAFVGGDTPSSTLVPGGSADVILRVNNPNSVPVQVYSVSTNGSATADAAHPSCTVTGVTFTAPASPLSPTATVPASGSLLVHLPGAASMDSTSQSACQGATFRLPVTMSARQ